MNMKLRGGMLAALSVLTLGAATTYATNIQNTTGEVATGVNGTLTETSIINTAAQETPSNATATVTALTEETSNTTGQNQTSGETNNLTGQATSGTGTTTGTTATYNESSPADPEQLTG